MKRRLATQKKLLNLRQTMRCETVEMPIQLWFILLWLVEALAPVALKPWRLLVRKDISHWELRKNIFSHTSNFPWPEAGALGWSQTNMGWWTSWFQDCSSSSQSTHTTNLIGSVVFLFNSGFAQCQVVGVRSVRRGTERSNVELVWTSGI